MNTISFNYLFLFGLLAFLLSTCQKKDLDIQLTQVGCKNMKIVNAKYATISDPSCGGTSDSAEYKITFSYDEKNRDCLKRIVVDPTFYRKDQSKIIASTYTTTLLDTDNSVVINSNTVTFTFKSKFSNLQDANDLNNIVLIIHTENTLGEQSKDLQVRINGSCSEIDASRVPVQARDTISSQTTNIQLKLWDDGQEDGDIVSVALNDNWVPNLQNYSLKKAGETFFITVPLNGPFKLVLVAMNQGTVGPNTCALSVNGGKTVNLKLDLVTGQAVQIFRK